MSQKLTSFLNIQETLSQSFILLHNNPEKVLWIDLNASKEFGFKAIVFYITSSKTISEECWPSANTIQPILFFFRLLAPAKRNFWLIELEIAGFVWVVKKVRHIIESSKSNIII